MDILDAENEMIPIDVLSFSNCTYKPPPLKSPNDKKEYSVVKLSNGLTALLISESSSSSQQSSEDDEQTEENNDFMSADTDDYDESGSLSDSDNGEESSSQSESSIGVSALESDSSSNYEVQFEKSACAICIDVGSFSDPEEIPGLARLLEHVLGAGSRSHPGEEKFGSMLNEFGGSFYSSTKCEYTTFYFDCPGRVLHFALERFSKQLISPILDHDTIENETMNMKFEFLSSKWFNDQMSRSLIMFSTAEQSNPAHKFVNGNRITQGIMPQDKVLKHVCEFWKKNYSAHRITLAIQSKRSLKTLESWVIECFSNFPCNNLPADTFPVSDFPFQMSEFCKLFTVEPIEEDNVLQISWVLPPIFKLYKSKPLHYIKWLISQEYTGSLVAYLRMKNWASRVLFNTQRNGLDNNSIYSIFAIKLMLTKEGSNHLEETWGAVFSYMDFLRETVPAEWIFSEMKIIADNQFRFAEDGLPLINVKTLAENMQIYSSVDYIQGEHLFYNYDADLISQLLDLLKADKANIIVTSSDKAKNVALDNVEQWLGKKYNVTEIPKELPENHLAREYFCLPKKNPFMVNDFSLLPSPEDSINSPEKICHDNSYEIWYKQSTNFLIPYGCLNLKFISPEACKTAKSSLLLKLYIHVLDRLLCEDISLAIQCGFDYSVDSDNDGMTISLYGFNEKLELFLDHVLECVRRSERASDLISEGLFEDFCRRVKWELCSKYKPFKLCYQLMQKIMLTPYWTYLDEFQATETELLTVRDLDYFLTKFLRTSHLKCIINGNISKEQAAGMADTIKNAINALSSCTEDYLLVQVSQLPLGELICRVQSFDQTNPYEYLINYYQYGQANLEEKCAMELLVYMMRDELYNISLRNQLLCNLFACSYRADHNVIGLLIALKSRENLQLVNSDATEFLISFSMFLEDLTVEDFKLLKSDFIGIEKPSPNDLIEETEQIWSEIREIQTSGFDHQKRRFEAIEKISKQYIREMFMKLVDGETIRKLSVQVESLKKTTSASNIIGTDIIEEEGLLLLENESDQSLEQKLIFTQGNGANFIDNIEEFKSTLSLYPTSNSLA